MLTEEEKTAARKATYFGHHYWGLVEGRDYLW
jgi:hypothetical protein